MARLRDTCILPLPEAVVAHIKSSTAIVSLPAVVLGLLENALDAGATKIEATVDFGRGGCSIEDNGLGIAPPEFGEDGRLAKPYCTSKYLAREACLGGNGTFLASLAAMSLLTVTSHHHEHRVHNSITFHHAKVIDRQLPAPPQHELRHEKHGTRVTVRNLFGNLPVRVKQRAVAVEHRAEHARLWETLKRDVTGLVLGWRGSVSLRIRDADNQATFHLNGQSPGVPTSSCSADGSKPRSAELRFMLNTLTQANSISVDDWSAWVPASASTPTISIKGAISLDPAPTKRVQFISLGIRPLSADSEHNELYDEINRIFALSSFGTMEDDVDVDETEKIRRQNDKRVKSGGYTHRQLRARKGVDRYPMFYLRISFKHDTSARVSDGHLLDNETDLQAVLNVLNAVITQWLSVHQFRPRKRTIKRWRPDTGSASMSDSNEKEGSVRVRPPEPSPSKPEKGKRKRPVTSESNSNFERAQQRPFAEWSRIKSGKADFYENIWTSGRQATHSIAGKTTSIAQRQSNEHSPSRKRFATCSTEPVLPGAFNVSSALAGPLQYEMHPGENEPCSNRQDPDDKMIWIHPSTKQVFLLNARTGCVVSQVPKRPHTDTPVPSLTKNTTDFDRSLRIRPRSTAIDEGKTPWLDGLLQTWDNPIFNVAEKQVPQVSLEEHQFHGGDCPHSRHFDGPRAHIDKAFNGSSVPSVSKLSKTDLQNAQVIAQLDKKFILVKMRHCSNLLSDRDREAEVLIMIDQHAADERIRVETLLAELCAPLPNEPAVSQYRSKLGHKSQVTCTILEKPLQFSVSSQEQMHFTAHAARFGAWGILFDISAPRSSAATHNGLERAQPILSVTTLPPGICERCKADPQLLITLLRSMVWKYAEDPPLSPLEHLLQPTESQNEDSPPWLRRLSTCPQSLVDLINSRACRSAIMFNDELTAQQCQDLVSNLSKCVFPFMCAHGRPSMVPLVDLGHGREGGLGFGLDANEDAKEGFVHAWKQWKQP